MAIVSDWGDCSSLSPVNRMIEIVRFKPNVMSSQMLHIDSVCMQTSTNGVPFFVSPVRHLVVSHRVSRKHFAQLNQAIVRLNKLLASVLVLIQRLVVFVEEGYVKEILVVQVVMLRVQLMFIAFFRVVWKKTALLVDGGGQSYLTLLFRIK